MPPGPIQENTFLAPGTPAPVNPPVAPVVDEVAQLRAKLAALEAQQQTPAPLPAASNGSFGMVPNPPPPAKAIEDMLGAAFGLPVRGSE